MFQNNNKPLSSLWGIYHDVWVQTLLKMWYLPYTLDYSKFQPPNICNQRINNAQTRCSSRS